MTSSYRDAVLLPSDAATIAVRYGLGDDARLVGPVDRGEQGVIWRLEAGGQAFAVKETHTPLSQHQARLAYDLHLRAAVAGVATPRQLLTTAGEVMITAGATLIRVFVWTEMSGPARDLDPAEIGELLAILHRAGGAADPPLHPWYYEPVGEMRWKYLIEELRAAQAPFAGELADQVPDLVAMEQWLTVPDPPYLLGHRDLWADNLRRWSGPGPLVIDWDNCGPVPPAHELAMVLVEFGTDHQRARALDIAYREAGGPARITSPTDLTMPIAALTHIVELGVRQWFEAADDEARDRATGRVMEFVDSPLTSGQVLELVDWLAPASAPEAV